MCKNETLWIHVVLQIWEYMNQVRNLLNRKLNTDRLIRLLFRFLDRNKLVTRAKQVKLCFSQRMILLFYINSSTNKLVQLRRHHLSSTMWIIELNSWNVHYSNCPGGVSNFNHSSLVAGAFKKRIYECNLILFQNRETRKSGIQ